MRWCFPSSPFAPPPPPRTADVERHQGKSALDLSRWTSLALFLTYCAFLVFQLKTHLHLYEEQSDEPDPNATPRTAREIANEEADEEEEPVMTFWGAVCA